MIKEKSFNQSIFINVSIFDFLYFLLKELVIGFPIFALCEKVWGGLKKIKGISYLRY